MPALTLHAIFPKIFSHKMVRTKINGIVVDMPFEPYAPQLVTMSKLIECFTTSTSALIESPTGTGKSLSIICSVLAYNEHVRRNSGGETRPFKIFICSRTHKQLDQLVEQLRKTSYRPRMTILGSKSQYCINPKLKSVDDKNTACSDLIKAGGCMYFNGKDRLVKRSGDKVFDIEELKSDGRKCAGCPYFASRALQGDADVVFAPYNYLIETNVREASEITLDNAILIIDEAHNIEDCCRTAGSIELTSRLLDIITNEVVGAIKRSALLGETKGEFINLLDIFRKMREFSEAAEFDVKGFGCQMRIRRGKEIISELEKIGITKESFLVFKNSLQAILKDDDAKELLSLNTSRLLQEIERTIGMVLFTGTQAYAYCFTRYNEHGRYSYNFWLLDPSVMFLPLVSKIKSISLLSGTLTPFSSFSSELKYAFHHKLVAPHILRDEQVYVCGVRKGHLNQEMCGTYSVSETFGYLEQVSRIVSDVAEQVKAKGGTLVFVPSYTFLNRLAGRIKDAIAEPKDGGMAEFERQMASYKCRIAQKRPAIFLCVYRGKAAEGIDFKDEYARAVVAVGIPYPSIKDPQIGLKKEYNDRNGGYNGKLWYEAQAFRAVNQALGRAVRHSKDWGCVFLVDSRYSDRRYQSSLPSWVSKNLKSHETYLQCLGEFRAFISAHELNKENKNN